MNKEHEKIINLINGSGHLFHQKVSDLLKSLKWSVVDSQFYNDPDTSKAREIDIIAEKEFSVGDVWYDEADIRKQKMVVRLILECKYITSPVVFWFKDKDKNKAMALVKNNSILNNKPDYYITAEKNRKFHYLETENATSQWAQENKDVFQDAMHKTLKALIFDNEFSKSHYEIKYPVIVVNNFEKIKKKENESDNYSDVIDNFHIESNYSYKDSKGKNVVEYFLIDVVSFELLESFIDKLEKNDIAVLKENLVFDLRQRRNNVFNNKRESYK
jgi:hypothetical protein